MTTHHLNAFWLTLTVGTKRQMPPPRIAVPAYIHPGAYPQDWEAILRAGPGAVPLVVANVADGPGRNPDADWADVLAALRRRGIRALGYVDTGYLGRLPAPGPPRPEAVWLDHVRADIAAWYRHYGDDVGGIFLDRAHSSCDTAATYRHLSGEVKRRHPGAVTALNPGTVVPRCFEHAADLLLTFEGDVDRYLASGPAAGDADWAPTEGSAGLQETVAARVWHVVYAVPATRLAEVVARARRRGVGLLYVTDRSQPNPWGTLTSDWEALTGLLAAGDDVPDGAGAGVAATERTASGPGAPAART